MGEEAVFAFATTIASLKMITRRSWIVAKAASGTELAMTFPVELAWFPTRNSKQGI